jgi:hypothetical protein
MSDLERAVKALMAKQPVYNTLWAYYDGNQPLRYSTERLQEVFRSISARFTQNWCEVVVDVFEERINIEQFQVTNNEAAAKDLNDWWYASGMHLDADDVHLCALVTGEAFVIVWPEDGVLDGHYNDSRLVHLFYDPANPRRKAFGVKWYEDAEAKKTYLTLYYPDRLEYYAANRLIKDLPSAGSFKPLLLDEADEASYMADNPLGTVPIFHYRREMRAIKSELGPSVLDTQDAINKLMSDMMVAAEFGAFRQRYVISQADVGSLKNAPNEIWDLPAGDGLGQGTQVGEFGQTDLSMYMNQLQELANAIGKMKRLPAHYFHLGARADPSGETLIGLESPLIKRVRKYMKRFEATWVEVAALVALWQGINLGAGGPYVVYDDPRISQPKTLAETRKINVEAGIPLHTQLRQEGWTPRELAEMDKDKQTEQQAAQQGIAAALLAAQRDFDQS